jgi:hypothetical protein
MRKVFEFLMDLTLVLVFILISSNYIDTLPRYTVKPRETETKLVKSSDETKDGSVNTTVTPSVNGFNVLK